MDILRNLGFDKLIEDDICAVHRLWAPSNSRDVPRVIVKFVNRKIVEWSLSHPENLQIVKEKMGLDLTMSESLCPKNSESFNMCKWLKDAGKIHNHYTRNGYSKVVINRGDRPVMITHPLHLRKKFEGIPASLSK